MNTLDATISMPEAMPEACKNQGYGIHTEAVYFQKTCKSICPDQSGTDPF